MSLEHPISRTDLAGYLNAYLHIFYGAPNYPAAMLQFPLFAYYRCSHACATLSDFLNMVSPDTVTAHRQVEGFDPIRNTARVHPADRAKGFWHQVVEIDGKWVVDLTYRQVDVHSPFPLIETIDEYKDRWFSYKPFGTEDDPAVKTWKLALLSTEGVNHTLQDYGDRFKQFSENATEGTMCLDGVEEWHTVTNIPSVTNLHLLEPLLPAFHDKILISVWNAWSKETHSHDR